jgi:hypothetical protein
MHRCRFILAIALWALLSVASSSAHLWESQVEIEKRYGPAIKTTGYPDRRTFFYVFEGLEIRIKFFNGISEAESYFPSAKDVVFGDGEIRRLLESNSARAQWREQAKDDWVIDTRNGRAYAELLRGSPKPRLNVYTHASVERDDEIFLNSRRTLKEETFQGVATMRREGKTTRLVVATGDRIIFIPWSDEWWNPDPSGRVTSGKTYSITLRDEDSLDENVSRAFLSDRDHKDYYEAVNDSKSYLLVRVQDGDDIVFDRSVCEVHHIKMSETMADVQYGMQIGSPYDRNFPHHRKVVEAGCLVEDTKKAPLYICPKCVEGCERSKL